jgi:hypothetical protein
MKEFDFPRFAGRILTLLPPLMDKFIREGKDLKFTARSLTVHCRGPCNPFRFSSWQFKTEAITPEVALWFMLVTLKPPLSFGILARFSH